MLDGIATTALRVRVGKKQENIDVPLCSLSELLPTTQLTTNLGTGSQHEKAVLNLKTGRVTLLVKLPTSQRPLVYEGAFSDTFTDAMG